MGHLSKKIISDRLLKGSFQSKPPPLTAPITCISVDGKDVFNYSYHRAETMTTTLCPDQVQVERRGHEQHSDTALTADMTTSRPRVVSGHITGCWSYLVILPVWAMSLQLCSGHVISRVGLAAWCGRGGSTGNVPHTTSCYKGTRGTSIGGNIIRQPSFLPSTWRPYQLPSH